MKRARPRHGKRSEKRSGQSRKRCQSLTRYRDRWNIRRTMRSQRTKKSPIREKNRSRRKNGSRRIQQSITSLCYSCKRYADCNVKTGTCENCDQYVNKAEAEKTDEQRYDEEQAAIDRETARKLREQEQEEKMNNLPSDSREEKEYIRLSTDTFEDVIAGRRPYLILKNDKIRTGMIVSALEFMQGRATGRELALEIVCMDRCRNIISTGGTDIVS